MRRLLCKWGNLVGGVAGRFAHRFNLCPLFRRPFLDRTKCTSLSSPAIRLNIGKAVIYINERIASRVACDDLYSPGVLRAREVTGRTGRGWRRVNVPRNRE